MKKRIVLLVKGSRSHVGQNEIRPIFISFWHHDQHLLPSPALAFSICNFPWTEFQSLIQADDSEAESIV